MSSSTQNGIEPPERITYGTPSLASLFAYPLHAVQAADFLDYVVSLNRNRRGWVDLLLRRQMLQTAAIP